MRVRTETLRCDLCSGSDGSESRGHQITWCPVGARKVDDGTWRLRGLVLVRMRSLRSSSLIFADMFMTGAR